MLLDPLFEHVSALAGAPPEQIKVIACLLFTLPLASLFTRIPDNRPNVKHWYSIAVTTLFLGVIMGDWAGELQLLGSCCFTYVIVIGSNSRRMPWVVFLVTMGHLALSHIQRLFATNTAAYDITFSQMVLVQKLTSFAWNVYDGRRKAEELDSAQLETRLSHVPSPLAFLGYCLFFPSFLIGPSLDYNTYDAVVLGTIFNTPTTTASSPNANQDARSKRVRVPYGQKRTAYLHLILGLVFLAIFSLYGERASYHRILTPTWYTWGILTRLGFVQLAGVMARVKYYAVWSLAEAGCIMTGAGFNGYDPKTGRTLWNRLRNVNILAIETAESFKVVFDNWNCRTNIWLRDCVYKRLVKKGKKPGSKQSMATFVTSAFWHGFEPGYYFAFVLAGVLVALGRQFRHFLRPYFLPSPAAPQSSPNSLPKYPYPNFAKRIYDIVGWVMVQINLNFAASAFLLLSFSNVLTGWTRMWWYSPIMTAVSLALLQGGGRRALRKGIMKGGKAPVPSIRVAPPSPDIQLQGIDSQEEKEPNNLRWVKHDLDNASTRDHGSGVTPANMLDEVMKGAETPRVGTPRSQTPSI